MHSVLLQTTAGAASPLLVRMEARPSLAITATIRAANITEPLVSLYLDLGAALLQFRQECAESI